MNDSNPLKAVKEKCIDCMGGQQQEVKCCPATACPLHPFRLGKNPYRKRREMTAEQKAALSDRLNENGKNNTINGGKTE